MTPLRELVEAEERRFWAKVDRGAPDKCWEWTGGRGGKGYGRFRIDGKTTAAHRVAYELLVAPIPEGFQLDHLCRNTRCVNPAHLEPVTNRENVLRGVGPTAQNVKKTHCVHGHELTEENTIRQARRPEQRRCRKCEYAATYHYKQVRTQQRVERSIKEADDAR